MLQSSRLFQAILLTLAVELGYSFLPSSSTSTIGHYSFQPSTANAGISTRRYILQDYNAAGLDTSFEDDDEHMDQWLNARLEEIRSMSREALEWELYHNDVDCRGTHEELVCRLLKARLETSHKIMSPPEEYFARKNYEAAKSEALFTNHQDQVPSILEEPTISTFEDDTFMDANVDENLSPDQHWSTTNNRQAAISLDDYDESRRRLHFERNKEWFNDKKSSFPGNQNQIIIDDEDLGGIASFSNTGSTTFPEQRTVQQEPHHDPFDSPHYPDSHFYDEYEVSRKAPRRQPRDLYRPDTHPNTNAHEKSKGRALYKPDEKTRRKIYRQESCIEIPFSMDQGVPIVSLHMQRKGQFDSSATPFIIDTGRHTSSICKMAINGPKLSATPNSSSITKQNDAAAAQLKSAQDDLEATFLLSSSDFNDEGDMVLPRAHDDLTGSLSTPTPETPPLESFVPLEEQTVSLDGFWTHQGLYMEAPTEMALMEDEEQILYAPHGCIGMDILGTFDSVEFDFDHGLLRLYTGETPSSHPVIAEATIQPLSLNANLPDLYTLPLRVDGKGPANMLISTALPSTVMTWKGVNDSLGLSRHSNEISDIESTFSPYSTVASHFTHHLTVFRKLDFGTGKRLIRVTDIIPDDIPHLPGLPHLAGMDIPVGQFPTNIGHNEELNQAFERKRTGGIIGMDILSRCSILRLSLDRTMEIQMFGRHANRNDVVLRP